MSRFLPHVSARLFDRPLLIEPRKLQAIIAGLAERVGVTAAEIVPASATVDAPGYDSTSRRVARPYAFANGIAEISVIGPLVMRAGSIGPDSAPLAAYKDISRQLRAAVDDPEVKGILLRLDSPGGEAAGCFDLADEIFKARAAKPIVALAEDMALSGGYAIASVADEIVATQTGYVGSIGVITTHVDYSRAESNAGIAVTHIHAGARKAGGSPHFPLDPESRDEIQAEIDHLYGIFVSSVARGRNVSDEKIRETEARVYAGAEALERGLIDAIGNEDVARERLQSLIARRASSVSNPYAVRSTGFSAIPAAKNAPASGDQKEVAMIGDLKTGPEGGAGEIIDLAAKLKETEAKLAKQTAIADANASVVASLKMGAKTKLIEKATVEGRLVPANLASVMKLADVMEEAELETYLGGLPKQIHAKAVGVADNVRVSTSGEEDVAGQLGMTAAQMSAFDAIRLVHLDGTVTLKDGRRVSGESINAGRA